MRSLYDRAWSNRSYSVLYKGTTVSWGNESITQAFWKPSIISRLNIKRPKRILKNRGQAELPRTPNMIKIALAAFTLLGLIIFWVHDLIAFALQNS